MGLNDDRQKKQCFEKETYCPIKQIQVILFTSGWNTVCLRKEVERCQFLDKHGVGISFQMCDTNEG